MSVRVIEQEKVLAGALRDTHLFGDWPLSAVQRVREQAELWIYQEGEVITEYGNVPRGLWGIASGCVSSYRMSVNKKTFLQGPHWRGDVFGLTAALDGHPSPLTHAARTVSLVFLIPGSALRAVLHDSAEAAHSVSVFLCMRSRIEYEGAYAAAVSSLRCRVAKYLAYLARGRLMLLEAAADGSGNDPSPVDLTQSELASMIGISRQTLNRTLAPFLRANIIVRENDAIRVVNFKKLLTIIEEDEPATPAWRAEILSWDEKLRHLTTNKAPIGAGTANVSASTG
jgi:CRP/FNR family transcriptional regulator, cyclic AMP receptor protein